MTIALEAARYAAVRQRTVLLCEPLTIEDHMVQSMPDASPLRWHLAHTTWFFETFVLVPHAPGYVPVNPRYAYLFNSYYNGVGDQFPRTRRGTQSRPTVAQIHTWRRRVDEAMMALLGGSPSDEVLRTTVIGIHHEEQHQELMVTDIKHGLMTNPMWPVYRQDAAQVPQSRPPQPATGMQLDAGFASFGHAKDTFCFDNETPAHKAWTPPFGLDGELVTNRQWLEFMGDGGYTQHALWLSDGWSVVQERGWQAPLYWVSQPQDGCQRWLELTLAGARPVDLDAPVAHISFFEADAFARWAGARLPTEFEWERAAAAAGAKPNGTMLDDGVLHPVGASVDDFSGLRHMFGEVWEWTSSAYRPYPGYCPLPGALGEYNGKFMNGQYVLKGGSCATGRDHIRATYRNFFAPDKRWQFTGMRLARDR